MNEELNKSIDKASELYSDKIAVRTLVQAIPYVGGSIDMLFSGRGAKIQFERLEHLILELQKEFDNLRSIPNYDEESFLDLVIQAMDSTIKTRSSEKRTLFAKILTKHIVSSKSIEESEIALRISSELDLVHIQVLVKVLELPANEKPFEGRRMFGVSEKYVTKGPLGYLPLLQEMLPHHSEIILRSACSELLARGLLFDEGNEIIDMKSLEYFKPTQVADWLKEWLVQDDLFNV